MASASRENLPWPIFSVILLVSLLVITGGMFFYNSQKNKIINEKQNEIAAIASLKINEIENWRIEHIRDAEILSGIIPRNQLISDFLAGKENPGLNLELLQRMKIFMGKYDYHSILIVDTTGTVRLRYPPADDIAGKNEVVFKISQMAELNNSEISLTDLHYSDDLPGMVHIDLLIPLFSSQKRDHVRTGTIFLRIDPGKTLYPLIQSWPTPSKTSETLIIRAENDSVLYLNELRHQKKTAVIFKLPANENLPAARAVAGYEGIFEGTDYRGVPVISFLKKIPDSPWFMVAKVDKKEIDSPLNEIVFFICTIAILVILSFTVSIIYFWRNQRIRYLKELNYTKDKFFSILSHDLRSPFTSINGFAGILNEDLQREILTAEDMSNVRKAADMILFSSQKAIDLIQNLTEWSRLHTDRLVFKPSEIDLVSVIENTTDLMNVTALQKSISIFKDLPSVLKIRADREMISLVLRNLISNSIKFSYPGGSVYVSVIEKVKDVLVVVCDSGKGMKKELIDKLFRIEENVTSPGTMNEKGTGLGLILVKEFISLHGGKVYVESEEGKCSKFSFTLPLAHKQ
jgi:signal transduction histidine kinase